MVQQADGRQHCDRHDPVFQPHDAENFRQHQRQVQQQPRRVEVDFQQAAGGVGAQQENQHQARKLAGVTPHGPHCRMNR